MKRTILAVLIGLSGAMQMSAQETDQDAELIWIEGENAVAKQVHSNAWFEAVDPAELSGGAWLANFSEPREGDGFGEYVVEIPETGTYHFWVRANPRGTGLLYRIDDGDWQLIDVEAMRQQDQQNRRDPDDQPRVVQETSISIDAGWDSRFIAWLRVGEIALTEGLHKIVFSLGGTQAEKRYGALDCFVLTRGRFTPNFKFKPGEGWENLVQFEEGETWAFEPSRDAFSDEAMFDLRSLNEDVAGQSGFIRRSPDGNGFVRGDGEPIRCWAGTTYVHRNAWREVNRQQERAEQLRQQGNADRAEQLLADVPEMREQAMAALKHHARFLAKRGVNIVRNHSQVVPQDPDQPLDSVYEEAVDAIHRLVAVMKQEGIYTAISPYWGSHADYNPNWDIPDPENNNLAALVFFVPEVQEAYKSWLRAIYEQPNPYTGVPLAKDPAVAVIQIQNEDSMLFYTMQRVGGEARELLRRQYADWLIGRYGSLERAMDAWEGYAHPDDDLENGLPGMFIVWEFTRDAREEKGGVPGREKRLADQLQFMAETMYNWNAEVERFLREELGCEHLVNAGNWRTVDPVLVDDAERWSYTANEVIGKNHYYGGQHKGFQVGWKISPGHYFTNWSALKRPTAWPTNIKQVQGHPFGIFESLWVPPLRYQSEGPLMVAGQQSLTGLDLFFWFATGKEEWQPVGNKWTFATPMQKGQFPAPALLYRKGYLAEGEPVLVEHRRLEDIWMRRPPLIAEGVAWDPNRDIGDLPVESGVKTQVPQLAFLVGPVRTVYDSDPARSRIMDLEPYIDEDAGEVRSNTGQITTDIETGVYRINAPKAQGAAGFLGEAGEIVLDEVTIDCDNEYASIVVVPLDDRPIAESGRLLVQVGTVTRPTGWKARPAEFMANNQMIEGFRIVEVGDSPWQIEKTRARLTVLNDGLSKATVLDVNGEPVRDVPVQQREGELTLQLPPDTMYLVLE